MKNNKVNRNATMEVHGRRESAKSYQMRTVTNMQDDVNSESQSSDDMAFEQQPSKKKVLRRKLQMDLSGEIKSSQVLKSQL
jgi:hypothetical protein